MISYRDSGVNIDAGNELVDRIKNDVERTKLPGVLGRLGGFGALFEVPVDSYVRPVLVSGTDGVGTKLKVALKLNRYDTIGIDLVAMCVNDVLTVGAEPLFFLDYYATGKLNVDIASEVIKGIADGCIQAGCSLVGGETAELPGLYSDGDYDLAGFCVGVVEKSDIIDGSKVKPGDTLIGIASSGPHSNGFSLIRKILSETNYDLNHKIYNNKTIGEMIMEPTRIYVKPMQELFYQVNVGAIAHITGGGLTENVPRILPNGTKAVINMQSWKRDDLWVWLQRIGGMSNTEMTRTFNCGVGMVVCVPSSVTYLTINTLNKAGEKAWKLGYVDSVDSSILNKPFVEYVW